MELLKQLLFVCVAFSCIHDVIGAAEASPKNFLFLPMGLELTHKRSIWPIAEALGKKGHHVTFWSALLQNKTDPKTYVSEDVVTLVKHELFTEENMKEFHKQRWFFYGFKPHALIIPWLITIDLCEGVLRSERHIIDELMQRRKWDLVVIDIFFSPCGFIFAKHIKAPVVYWSPTFQSPSQTAALGIPSNPAFVPEPSATPEHLPLGDALVKRVINAFNTVYFNLVLNWFVAYHMRKMAPGELDNFSFESAIKNGALSVAQMPPDLNWPTPWVPNLIHLHDTCRPPKGSLPADIEKFVSDPSSKGTIVVAFGHMGQWSAAPPASYTAFRDALLRLKDYRIIWQCDIEEEDRSVAKHIRRMKWIPQNELMHHAKTVLYVTHGGLKSVMEGFCNSIPMVAMPLFAEQYRNTAALLEKQVGIYLDKFLLSSKDYIDNILESMLSNKTYAENIRKLNSALRDKPIAEFDYAVHWFELAARHGQKLHMLRLRASNFFFPTLYCLDCIAFLLVILSIVSYFIYILLQLLWKRLVAT